MDEVKILFYYLKESNIKKPVMVDVGSHTGTALHQFAVDGWSVFAFEPNPVIRQKSLENIKNWNIQQNVKVNDFALSDSNQDEIEFFISDESTGISSLIPFHKSHESKFKVQIKTFTSWENENPLEKVDFLKIDVEGNDIKVLKGFNWNKFSPKAIVVEYEDSKTQSLNVSMLDILSFLKEKGYSLIISEWHPIEKYGIEHKWRQFIFEENASKYDRAAWGNLIAIKDLDIELFLNSSMKAYQEDNQKLKKQASDHLAALNVLRNSKFFKLRYLYHRLKKYLG